MPFRDVLGQTHAVETIRRGLARGRLHHALLFAGPSGVGKELTAYALACAIVCTSAPKAEAPEGSSAESWDGCGSCGACHRVLTHSSEIDVPLHPDVVVVARGLYPKEVLGRSTEEKVEISVDQIRRVVLEKIHLHPHEAPQRLVILRGAEDLNASAANALLKTLEEPPAHTRFVLLTDRPGELLPTIRSRTQLVRFAPLTDALVEKILVRRGIDQAIAARVAPLAGGSAETALGLADPTEASARGDAVDRLRTVLDRPLADLLDATSSYANTGEARATLKEHLGALAAEEAGGVRQLVLGGATPAAIDRGLLRRDAAIALVESLEKNANVPLALEAAWLRIHRR
jgi:DNA polymerase-3 subunit delta'